MQHRIAGSPHRPTGRRPAGHAAPAHLYDRARDLSQSAHPDDAAYFNASPWARLIARLLLRFF